MMAAATALMVGTGDIQVSKGDTAYCCSGIGSCVGVVLFDPTTGVCGVVHAMFPESRPDTPTDNAGRYADTGILELVHQMTELGADPSKIVAAYAGGAQAMRPATAGLAKLDIGGRNVASVAGQIAKHGFRLLACDTGGSAGRTLDVTVHDGRVRVRTLFSGEKVLCSLKG